MDFLTMPLDAGHRARQKQHEEEIGKAAEAAVRLYEMARERRIGGYRFGAEHEARLDKAMDELVKVIQGRKSAMHYRNGREAKNGDKIVHINHDGTELSAVGILHGATPGNDYCNGTIAPIQNPVTAACLCDCLHMDDLAAMLKEKGLDKRPPGK